VAPGASALCREAPRDEREKGLADALCAVLGRQDLSRHESYFELGGDSITAIQLVGRLKRTGWDLSVRDLLRHPTVAELAPMLKPISRPDSHGDQAVAGPVPLTAVQHWFFANHAGEIHHFNQAVLLRPEHRYVEGVLRAVLAGLHAHHDALRIIFPRRDGSIWPINEGPERPVSFEVVNLRDWSDGRDQLERHASAVQRSLDLEHGPLFRAVLYQLATSDRLLLVIHHLVIDGVSWRILLEDLGRGYRQGLEGAAIHLGPKSTSFRAWSEAQSRFAAGRGPLEELPYWESVRRAAAASAVPNATPPFANLYGDCRSLSDSLSAEETEHLIASAGSAYHTEVNDLLLVALGRVMSGRQSGCAAWVTIEGHGRESLEENLDVTRTVGWFTSMFPFLLGLPQSDLSAQIRHVKDALRSVPRKGAGYGILRHLAPGTDASIRVFDERPRVSFNYWGQIARDVEDHHFRFAEEPTGPSISPRLARYHDLDFVGAITGGRLRFSLDYDPATHDTETARRLLSGFMSELQAVTRYCAGRPESMMTASDFTCSGLSEDELEVIRNKLHDCT
jgi:non-ribosomal peptide synthase protein (TIGR01720 family)